MAKAKKLPSGNWRVRAYIGTDADGKKVYKSFTAPTRKEAEYMASEYMMHRNLKANTGYNMTVGDAIEKYIDIKSNILSPSTIRSHRGILRNHLDGIKHIKLSDLTREIVQQEINIESAKHSPKTVKNVHGLLSAALKMYYPEFVLNTDLPQKEKTEIYIPSKKDVFTLLDHTANDAQMHLAILLASCMGLRRGEICALTKRDIDMENKLLNVSKSMVLTDDKQWIVKQPKTYSGNRVLPIPDLVYSFLENYNIDSDNLFNITPNALSDRFFRLVKRCGITPFTFHALRHYYASVMMTLNIPNKYAMQMMGHASDNMLKNVYQHTMLDKKKEVEQAVTQFFSMDNF